ncbi:MAG: hypothetical protein D6731_19525 [Planctomycetota bacterium]|nr:MAG: hypothetical protein D6731_19525 [Planctomycetota bacterium]
MTARSAILAGAVVLTLAGGGVFVPLTAVPAMAQGIQGLRGGDAPLEINAEDGIEWRRDEQLYIARGNAVATRNDVSVYADVMTAHYRRTETGTTDIDRIDVVGNVRITTPTETVYGDRGAYDVRNGIVVLVGKDLRLEGKEIVITARDSLEYWETKRLAVARGNAVAVRADKRIAADVLSAQFAPDTDADAGSGTGSGGSDGTRLKVSQIEAFGNVRISTPREFARGEHGVYYVEREFATLDGAVRITREENQLNGEYAEIDLKSGVSRLLPAPPGTAAATAKRVRGLLVPKRKPKTGGGS